MDIALDATIPAVAMTDAGRAPAPMPTAPEAGVTVVADEPTLAAIDAAAPNAAEMADAVRDAGTEPPMGFEDDAGTCVEPPLPCPTDLPMKPSRNDVLQAFNAVREDVQACDPAPELSAEVVATVLFQRSGCVASVSIELDPPGEAEVMDCVAAAVAQVVVPPFCSDDFAVKFPFRLSSPVVEPRPRT